MGWKKNYCFCKKEGIPVHKPACKWAGKPVNYSVPSKKSPGFGGHGPAPEGFYHGPVSEGEYVGIYEGEWFRG